MADCGISITHTTILRRVPRSAPEFEKKWKRYAKTVGLSWRMEETYGKVRGQWTYFCRAVDGEGRTVDFWLSRKRERFENARVVIGGVELAQKIRKQQFDMRQLGGAQASDAEQWSRVRAA
jgi:transposase-like protein